jgi:hypothetical protein
MTERDERIAQAPGDRRIGDDECGDLDAPSVVALDDVARDIALDVVDELLAGGRELRDVVGEGRDQCPQRLRLDPATGGAELARGEVGLLVVALDGRTGDLDPAAGPSADRVEQLLAAHARSGVPEDDRRTVLRMLEVRDGLSEERVGAALDPGDTQQARLAEQRRRGEREQTAALVVVGAQVADLERGVLRAQIGAHPRDRAFRADLLGPGHQDDRRRSRLAPRHLRDVRRLASPSCGGGRARCGHGSSVPAAADVRRAPWPDPCVSGRRPKSPFPSRVVSGNLKLRRGCLRAPHDAMKREGVP